MTFRFRAAPLLALRQRQFDATQERLARANEDVAVAERLLEVAECAADEANTGYREALDRGSDNASLERHRNWIVQQRSHVDTRRRTQAECCGVAATASDAVIAAHRQVRVLERLRERASRRHDTEVRRREMKEIDLLATLQYARRMAEGGPT